MPEEHFEKTYSRLRIRQVWRKPVLPIDGGESVATDAATGIRVPGRRAAKLNRDRHAELYPSCPHRQGLLERLAIPVRELSTGFVSALTEL